MKKIFVVKHIAPNNRNGTGIFINHLLKSSSEVVYLFSRHLYEQSGISKLKKNEIFIDPKKIKKQIDEVLKTKTPNYILAVPYYNNDVENALHLKKVNE